MSMYTLYMYTLVIRIELEAMVLITIISKYRYDFFTLKQIQIRNVFNF